MSTHTETMSSAAAGSRRIHRSLIARVPLYLGALGVLATGIVHIQQFYGQDYSTIPTIGTLFFLNFVAAVVLTAGLIAPLGRVAGRHADAVRAAFAVGGVGFAVLSLVALFVSEGSGLFGFQENGYRMAIVLAIVAEAAAVVFLAVFLAADGVADLRRTRDRVKQPPEGR